MEFNERYLDILTAIGSHLSSTLEELHIAVGMNTSWCAQLSSLRKLEDVLWVFVDEEFYCTDLPEQLPLEVPLEDHFRDKDVMMEMGDEAMKAAFGDFENEPEWDFRVLMKGEYEFWDEIWA
jgi:hypothetical protein